KIELVKLLLDKGADINSPDHRGLTPIMIATSRGYEPIVQLLKGKSNGLENQQTNTKMCF
ncbi:MAG: ankyrin repeat domain-containing protein, partial [Desulfomonilaceae bacterium]